MAYLARVSRKRSNGVMVHVSCWQTQNPKYPELWRNVEDVEEAMGLFPDLSVCNRSRNDCFGPNDRQRPRR